MAKLTDIRGCKITVGGFTSALMADLKCAAIGMALKFTQTDTNYAFAYISDNGYIAMDSYLGNFKDSKLKEIFFYGGAFHYCEKQPQVTMLLDIRQCKIKIGGFTLVEIEQLNSALGRFNCNTELVEKGYDFVFIREDGETLFSNKKSNFEDASFKEIFLHNGNFYDFDIEKIGSERPSPVGAENAIHAALDHQPGDIVFNKSGFKYKQFLCLHPLDSNASLCQCDSGDILEVLNSELLSYSENLAIIKAETDNAKKLHDEYIDCIYKNNAMAIAIPFDDMDIEGIKIWIEFAKRVTINEK